jgi:hypothetical protein
VSAEGPEVFPSRFAGLGRAPALAIVGLITAALVWCLFVSFTRPVLEVSDDGPKRQARPDTDFYRNVIERVRGGTPYHEAAKQEFDEPIWSEGGFRPTSPFHWRTPVYAWVLAPLPGQTGMAVAGGLALLAAGFCFLALGRTAGPGPAFLTFLLIGPFAWCAIGDVYLFTELWAGILIALSVGAYGIGRWPVAVAAALVALFFRELVLPYCLLCFALALLQRRWAEVGVWVVGLALFALFYVWHVQQIRTQVPGEGDAKIGSWLKFGGTTFALAATQLSNVFLTNFHAAVSAVVLPLALLGLAGWRGEAGIRAFLTCIGYLAFFLVAVQPPYNAYWGLLIGPLLMLGLTALPASGRDLAMALRKPATPAPGDTIG